MKAKDLIVGEHYAAGLSDYSRREVVLLDDRPWERSYGSKMSPSHGWHGGYSDTGAPCLSASRLADDLTLIDRWGEFAAQFERDVAKHHRWSPRELPEGLSVHLFRTQELVSTWAVEAERLYVEREQRIAAAVRREAITKKQEQWDDLARPTVKAFNERGYGASTVIGTQATSGHIVLQLTTDQAEDILRSIR